MIPLVWLLLAQASGSRPNIPVMQTAIHDGDVCSRVLQIGVTASERVNPRREIAPGAPPLLAFRYFEGKEHHRFGDNELMLDDAGH